MRYVFSVPVYVYDVWRFDAQVVYIISMLFALKVVF